MVFVSWHSMKELGIEMKDILNSRQDRQGKMLLSDLISFISPVYAAFFCVCAFWQDEQRKGYMADRGLPCSSPVKSSRTKDLGSWEKSSFCNQDIAKLAQNTNH